MREIAEECQIYIGTVSIWLRRMEQIGVAVRKRGAYQGDPDKWRLNK